MNESGHKTICVLGRRDVTEAMRVAAGITIFGHRVALIFFTVVPDNATTREHAELLELSDIEPVSVVEGNGTEVVSPETVAQIIHDSDAILSI
jgi:hypothetical protein